MSKRELQRIEVLSQVIERRMTSTAAASLLNITPRQVQRLLKTFLEMAQQRCGIKLVADDPTIGSSMTSVSSPWN